MKTEVKEFQTLLEFKEDRHLVGIKFLNKKEEYDILNVKEATHQMFFCMMVKAAAVGHCMKVKEEHIYCSAASEVLGFTTPSKEVLSGEVAYKRDMYETYQTASCVAIDTPYLQHEVYGILLQPLEMFEQAPDIVIAFCNPYTTMRIVQGYSYKYGFAKQLRFAGMGGVCTELVARAYKNQDMNISFLCSGTRFAGEWRDDELGVAFPYYVFENVLDGVRKTMNTFESDDKKEIIAQKATNNKMKIEIKMGENYHGSSIGVAKLGIVGYHPKKRKREKEQL